MANTHAYPNFDIILEALNMSSVGVVITDAALTNNPVIYVNRGFEKNTGYPAEEVLGKNCRFLQGEDTNPEELAKVSDGVRNRHSTRAFLKNYRKNGTPFFNELTIDPIKDANGHPYFIGIQKDVTRERNYQLELEKSVTEIQKLSTPIVPITDNLSVLPLVGTLDNDRFDYMSENVSNYLDTSKEDYLVIDLSGLVDFNEDVVTNLVKFHRLLKLTGVELILTGLSPKFAMLMVRYEQDLANIVTFSTVKEALKHFS